MAGPRLIHCSYHKCLTVYYGRVMRGLFNKVLRWSGGYRHFNSNVEEFYRGSDRFRLASVNNHAIDLGRLTPFRMTRFLRDPRDLVVSGYFYHKRGAEEWAREPNPTDEAWRLVNGLVPRGMKGSGLSFAAYLESIPEEDGLLAELEFRRAHFDSMAAWPHEHPDVLVQRYEDVLGDEKQAFARIFEHYGLSELERTVGGFFVRRHALKKRPSDPHVRNPSSGQWRKRFTPRVREAFEAQHPGLIQKLGYPSE